MITRTVSQNGFNTSCFFRTWLEPGTKHEIPLFSNEDGNFFIACPVDDTHHILFWGHYSPTEPMNINSTRVQLHLNDPDLDINNLGRFHGDRDNNWAQDRAAMAEGAVSAKHKELTALAIGITQHCSGCIGFHVKALIKLGCSKQELEEMLAVCVYMGGGPALMYTAEALAAFDAMSTPPTV